MYCMYVLYVCMYVIGTYYYFLLNTDDIKYTIKTHQDSKFMYVLIHANDGIIFRSDKHFCWMDGYAAFRKGELLSGRLGKTIVYLHTYIHTYIHTYVHVQACINIRVHKTTHCVMHIHTYTF